MLEKNCCLRKNKSFFYLLQTLPIFASTPLLLQHALIDLNTHQWSDQERYGTLFRPRSWSMYSEAHWVPARRSSCPTASHSLCPFKWISDDTLVDESPGLMDTVENNSYPQLFKNGINYNQNGNDCLAF